MSQTSSEKLLEWSEKIKEQKLSEKTISTWCAEKEITYTTFLYWQRKIRQLSQSPKKEFIEIPEELPSLEISLKGIKIIISKEFDRSSLIFFLNLLKA
jgi:hypothetical protein